MSLIGTLLLLPPVHPVIVVVGQRPHVCSHLVLTCCLLLHQHMRQKEEGEEDEE